MLDSLFSLENKYAGQSRHRSHSLIGIDDHSLIFMRRDLRIALLVMEA
jgi:hypothetical protein